MGKTALVAGASGLVGNELLQLLLNGKEYEQVVAIVRRPLHMTHPKLDERMIDFGKIEKLEGLTKVNDVFCCLGTTIKKAKTKEAMKIIDVDYPIALAKLGKKWNAEQYLVISSMGADPRSSVFYSRMKGELEEELKTMGYPTLQIFRPSLLLGERKEFRLGEGIASKMMPALSRLMKGPLTKYRAIEAKTVARGMYAAAQIKPSGVRVYLSDEIEQLAEK